MQKVMIIGCPGSGKSTFARELSKVTDLPIYYLDMLWHKEDKTTVSQEVFDTALQHILCKEQWIIDGCYLRTMKQRMDACDTIILFDFPLEQCLAGIELRIGKPREDMPWIEEGKDPEFIQYIKDFNQDQLPAIYALLDTYHNQKDIVIFHSREDESQYLTNCLLS